MKKHEKATLTRKFWVAMSTNMNWDSQHPTQFLPQFDILLPKTSSLNKDKLLLSQTKAGWEKVKFKTAVN